MIETIRESMRAEKLRVPGNGWQACFRTRMNGLSLNIMVAAERGAISRELVRSIEAQLLALETEVDALDTDQRGEEPVQRIKDDLVARLAALWKEALPQ